MWDDGSGPPLRGRTDHDDQDGYHGGYGGGGRHGGSEDAYGYGSPTGYIAPSGYGSPGSDGSRSWEQGGGRRVADEVIEYDIPTTFLPVQGAPMTRPRRQRRKRRPVLTVALVTVATVSIGGGAGLLMARTLDRGGVTPSAAVAASPSTPRASASTPARRTVTPSVPAVRPSSATTKVSRSDPSRSAKPPSQKPSAAPKTSSSPSKNSASSTKVPTGDAALEASVLTLVNTERAKAGCKPVKSNSKLVLAARRHSQFMADTGKHAHDGIGDGTPQDRIEKAGYAWRGWGENIAWGYTSAASVMDGWMHSPGHKANILNCSYTEIGIGVDTGGINWTQDFGIPG